MHELGILNYVLKAIEQTMRTQGLTHVEKVVLQVGEISGVVPAYIEECFPAAVYKTPFADMELEMEVIEGIVSCNDCGEEFNGYRYNLHCPKCGGEDLTARSGREFIIKEIYAY